MISDKYVHEWAVYSSCATLLRELAELAGGLFDECMNNATGSGMHVESMEYVKCMWDVIIDVMYCDVSVVCALMDVDRRYVKDKRIVKEMVCWPVPVYSLGCKCDAGLDGCADCAVWLHDVCNTAGIMLSRMRYDVVVNSSGGHAVEICE